MLEDPILNGLLWSLVLNLLVGLLLLLRGKKLVRQGHWLLMLGLSAICIVGLLGVIAVFRGETEAFVRSWNWIGKGLERGHINVGFLKDGVSIVVVFMIAIQGLLLTFNRALFHQEPRIERFFSAVSFAVAGACLVWLARTPWLALAGTMLVIAGGFIGLGSRFNVNEQEAKFSSRFVVDHAWGLVLAILGTCVLAKSGASLDWDQSKPWFPYPEIRVGASFLVAGVFLLFRPFPLLGWATMPTENHILTRVFLVQLWMGLSAFCVLLRLKPQFQSIGLFPGFGWIAILAAYLAILCALFQKTWRRMILFWLSSAFSFSVAALAFASTEAAFSILVGSCLGAVVLCLAATALEVEGKNNATDRKKAIWSQMALWSGGLGASGIIGFVGCFGGLGWLTSSVADPFEAITVSVLVLLMALVVWRFVFFVGENRRYVSASWTSVLTPIVPILMSLGIFWTGAASGGAIYGVPDQVLAPLLTRLFQTESTWIFEDAFARASWFYWGSLFLGILGAYTSRRSWQTFELFAPGFVDFFSQAFKLDQLVVRGRDRIVIIFRNVDRIIVTRVWNDLVLESLAKTMRRFSHILFWLDQRVVRGFERAISFSIELPTRGLQMIQNGDLQWYLFFGVGTGVLLLLQFLQANR